MKSLASFQLKGILTSTGGSVAISNDILTDTAASFTNETILLSSDDNSVKELMVATASAGTLTISQRGLDQSTTKTTDTDLQHEFRTGTIGRVVASASDIPDLDGNNTFSGNNTHSSGKTTFTSTTEAQLRGQRVTTTQRNALTGVEDGDWIYNTTTTQTEWREGGSWVANAAGGSVPNASPIVAGKVEIATSAESQAGDDTGDTGAKVSVLPSDIAANEQSNTFKYGVDAEASDTYVIALTPTLTAYTDGQELTFRPNTANTGACTINIDTLGAKSIKLQDGTDPLDGEIATGTDYKLIYDGTNFVLQSHLIRGDYDDIITGTDDTKVTTPKDVSDLFFGKSVVASDVLKSSADTERTSTSTSYVKVKEIELGYFLNAGTARIKFDIKMTGTDGSGVDGRIYINGSPVGTNRHITPPAGAYATFSEDLAVDANDLVQLYIQIGGASSNVCFIENFRIYYNEITTTKPTKDINVVTD